MGPGSGGQYPPSPYLPPPAYPTAYMGGPPQSGPAPGIAYAGFWIRFLAALIDGIKILRKILAAPALKPYAVDEIHPGPKVTSDEDILAFCRKTGSTVYHPTSTCRMGNDPLAVVDQRLRLRGMDGLRVVDASVMPDLMSGNTNAPTIMIAEKASDMILEDAR